MTDSKFTISSFSLYSQFGDYASSHEWQRFLSVFFTHKGISVYDDIILLINRVLYSIPMFVDAAFYLC